MSDPYEFRPGGSLKLKRSSDAADGGSKKKKKSSKPKSDKDRVKEDLQTGGEPSQAESSKVDSAPGSGRNTPAAEKDEDDKKTAAEKRFEEKQRKRREERVKKLAAMTHKDRVHEFNAKLEALSEHHDIPKVGPG